MRKVLVALLCALMLMTFVACEEETPAPPAETDVLYSNDFSDAERVGEVAEGGERTINEAGQLVVESGKGFGVYMNNDAYGANVPAEIGKTYRFTFDVDASSLGENTFYVGAVVYCSGGHAIYNNTELKAEDITDSITVDVTCTSVTDVTVSVNGVSETYSIDHDDHVENLVINFTGWVSGGQVLVDNFQIVELN